MSPVLFGTGKLPRKSWFYFTENELTPGAARVGNLQSRVQPARRDGSRPVVSPWISTSVGRDPIKYVATVPQVFDLWQDPQERYDIFMNNYTERTWVLVTISDGDKEVMKTREIPAT